MNIYKVDFKRLICLLLPIILRKEILISFFKSLITPLETMHTSFMQFRTDTSKKMSYNSQTCHLRKMLNDKFDVLRRIKVEDVQKREPLMIYRRAEEKPVMLGTRMIHSRQFMTNGGFIVRIPASLTSKDSEIRAYIDYYKLITMKYQIIYN